MKTIFDKINLQHLECSAGICGHPEHLGIAIALLSIIALGISLKFRKQ